MENLEELKNLARKVLENVEPEQYLLETTDEGDVWLRVSRGTHDLYLGDMEIVDGCCFEHYGRLVWNANTAPKLAREFLDALEYFNNSFTPDLVEGDTLLQKIQNLVSWYEGQLDEQDGDMEKLQWEVDRLTAENESLRGGGVIPEEREIDLLIEIGRLAQWVSDLQSGMYINCVYCGHRYGPDPGTPVAMADVLKAHIEVCPEHPMSELKKENEELRKIIARGCEECESECESDS